MKRRRMKIGWIFAFQIISVKRSRPMAEQSSFSMVFLRVREKPRIHAWLVKESFTKAFCSFCNIFFSVQFCVLTSDLFGLICFIACFFATLEFKFTEIVITICSSIGIPPIAGCLTNTGHQKRIKTDAVLFRTRRPKLFSPTGHRVRRAECFSLTLANRCKRHFGVWYCPGCITWTFDFRSVFDFVMMYLEA